MYQQTHGSVRFGFIPSRYGFNTVPVLTVPVRDRFRFSRFRFVTGSGS